MITGANSYVGTNVEKWLMREPDKYYVETLDMKDPNWKECDFSRFDVVFHVSGIAHIKESKSNESLFYKINRDLTVETAEKAKMSGVKQFIFMSSMSVFGLTKGKIKKDTKKQPKGAYSLSKSEAEDKLILMDASKFSVCIVRAPMIYGSGSLGNFDKLVSMSRKTIFFPKIVNERSSIFILNLCAFISSVIELELSGYFHPQNSEYFCTYETVKIIRETLNKKTLFFSTLNFFLKNISLPILNKAFGNLVYDFSLSNYDFSYANFSTIESIIMSIEQEG